jgi:hypothetical protein
MLPEAADVAASVTIRPSKPDEAVTEQKSAYEKIRKSS